MRARRLGGDTRDARFQTALTTFREGPPSAARTRSVRRRRSRMGVASRGAMADRREVSFPRARIDVVRTRARRSWGVRRYRDETLPERTSVGRRGDRPSTSRPRDLSRKVANARERVRTVVTRRRSIRGFVCGDRERSRATRRALVCFRARIDAAASCARPRRDEAGATR